MEIVILNEWFDGNTLPKENPDGLSDDVLVDINGNRVNFAIGWYSFDDHEWSFELPDYSLVELDHLRWQYLPLAKYDKK